MTEHTGGTVRSLQCPLCPVHWSFEPPRWLGEPWTREQADAVLASHMKSIHPQTGRPS